MLKMAILLPNWRLLFVMTWRKCCAIRAWKNTTKKHTHLHIQLIYSKKFNFVFCLASGWWSKRYRTQRTLGVGTVHQWIFLYIHCCQLSSFALAVPPCFRVFLFLAPYFQYKLINESKVHSKRNNLSKVSIYGDRLGISCNRLRSATIKSGVNCIDPVTQSTEFTSHMPLNYGFSTFCNLIFSLDWTLLNQT